MSSIFSSNSEAFDSELLENVEEICFGTTGTMILHSRRTDGKHSSIPWHNLYGMLVKIKLLVNHISCIKLSVLNILISFGIFYPKGVVIY